MQKFCLLIILFIISIFISLGCSEGSGNPVLTTAGDGESPGQAITTSDQPGVPAENVHHLWDYRMIAIDPESLEVTHVPMRQVADHWNVLTWLEKAPCADCLKIADITPNPDGTLNVYVSIKHPFTNPSLTGFDVRGIVMLQGSHVFPQSGLVMSSRDINEGELVNADGYTTLYNPTTAGHGLEGYTHGEFATAVEPNLMLNAYKRFVTDDILNLRNAFYAGDEITANYKLDMPDPANPWVLGYAVDACWAPPIHVPVDNPSVDFAVSTNCPEAWKIEVADLFYDLGYNGAGLTVNGGTTILQIDVFDWQGMDDTHPVYAECPDLFDGKYEATLFDESIGYTRYRVELDNLKLPTTGRYPCLISAEAGENDPVGKPWLDLTAYQIYYVTVQWWGGCNNVTPPMPGLSVADVYVDGNTAYMACEADGLEIYDVSEPVYPAHLTRIPTPEAATSVYAFDGVAAVKTGDLQIIDADPVASSHIASTIDLPGTAWEMAGFGDKLYITDDDLHIVDIDPPESAQIVNTMALPYPIIYGIAAWDGYVYVSVDETDGDNLILIIDVDPPESAHVVNTIDGVLVPRFSAAGGYLYTIASGSFTVFDVDPPESASLVFSFDFPFSSIGMHISDGYAYVSSHTYPGGEDLKVIDVDPPESAHFIYTVALPYWARGTAVSSGFAYIAFGNKGLHIFDIDPIESAYDARTIGVWPKEFNGVAVSGIYVYLTDDDFGFNILGVNPPEYSYLFNTIYATETFGEVEEEGGYAFVVSTSGLKIIDVDPPESAYISNSVDMQAGIMELAGGYAYVISQEAGVESTIQIVDILPPESAHVVNSIDATVEAEGLALEGGFLYLTGYDQDSSEYKFIVFDNSSPESPQIIKTTAIFTAGQIDISNGYAFIAGEAFLQIIDIDPLPSAYLLKMMHADSWEIFLDVLVSGDNAYVLTGSSHVLIIDVEPPSSAFILKTRNSHIYPPRIEKEGNYLYSGGLTIFDIT